MVRVCRSGGKISLTGPIPEGWIRDFFAAHGKYLPTPPPVVKLPSRWSNREGLNKLLGNSVMSILSEKQKALQYYLSTDHAVEVFKTWFGPIMNTLENIEEARHAQLLNDLKDVF